MPLLTRLFINFGKILMMIETASFNGFIKAVFYIIAFYYIFKFLARLFLPMIVKKAVQKASQNFERQQYGPRQNQYQRPSDTITVDTSRAEKSREKKKVGEYVDYEELD